MQRTTILRLTNVTSSSTLITQPCRTSNNYGRKNTNSFDVTMGSYDGAETCELAGCFLLSQLQVKFGQNIGLHRDDGLATRHLPWSNRKHQKRNLPHIQRQRTTHHHRHQKTFLSTSWMSPSTRLRTPTSPTQTQQYTPIRPSRKQPPTQHYKKHTSRSQQTSFVPLIR